MCAARGLWRVAAAATALLVGRSAGAQQPPESKAAEPAGVAVEAEAAEKLYRDIYGPEHDRAAKSADAGEKLAFARRLAEGARLAAGNAALSRLLKRRAVEFAAADPAGQALALELLRGLYAEGATDSGLLERMADLQEKGLPRLKAVDRPLAAAELVYTLRLLADEQDRREECDAAAATLAKARRTVVQQLKSSKEALADIDAQDEVLQAHRKDVAAYRRALSGRPDDPAACVAAGVYLLTWKADPKGAAERFARSALAEFTALAGLLAKDGVEPIALGDAFRAAANSPGAGDRRTALLAHAAVAYKAALPTAEGSDAVRLKLLLTQLGAAALPGRPIIRPPPTLGGGPVPSALKERAQLKGHTGNITALQFSADGHTLVSADASSVRTWDAARGTQKKAVDLAGLRIISVAVSPDGRLAAAVARNGIVLLDIASGKQSAPLPGSDAARTCVFSPDGKVLATNLGDHVKLFHVASGQEKSSLPLPNGKAGVPAIGLRNPGFSPDGRMLAAASTTQDGPVLIWDAATSARRAEIAHQHRFVYQIVFSPDSRTLALCGQRGSITLFESAGGKTKGTLDYRSPPRNAAFFPGGAALAGGYFDGSIAVWKLDGVKQVFSVPAHTGRAGVTVAVSADGKTLASAGGDDLVRLWTVVAGD